MQKSRRMLSLFGVLALSISIVFPGSAFADTTRTAGVDRFLTAIQVAKAGWPNGADHVVLVNSNAIADGAVAGPLAYQLNAPILLTNPDNLTSETLQTLQDLHVKNITLIGGNGVISSQLEQDLKKSYTVERLGGLDRYETSSKVATKIGKTTKAVVVNGECSADAFSVTSWAASNKAPILYATLNSLPDAVKASLQNSGATDTYVIGGEGVVGAAVFGSLPHAQRFGGVDRYATAISVASGLQAKADTVYVASGQAFADAMVGANLAAKTNSPLIYVSEPIPSSVSTYLQSSSSTIKNIRVIGGTGVVSDQVKDSLESLIDPAKLSVRNAVASYFTNMPADSYKISESALKTALETNPSDYVVIDVRKADAYAAGHIKGAYNVPYGKDIADNLEKIRAVAKGKTVVVACYTGQTAGQTDSLLNLAGINTRSLNFGMGNNLEPENKGWLGMKYPTETTVNTLPNATPVASPNPEIDTLVKNYFNPMPDDSYKITSEQLKPLLDADASKYLVVDVRQAVDYAAGHIPGAINVPFGPEIAKNLINLKSLSQGKTMIVYCYTGQTAGQVDSMMNILGIPTKSLHFGFGTPTFIHGWSSTGYPVVTSVQDAVANYFTNMPSDSYKISESALKTALETNPWAYVVIDVRRADAYAAGHIKGAYNVPYGKDIADNLEKIRTVARDKTVVVACYTGQTAGQTDSLLNLAGIKTRSLNFGMGNNLEPENKGWLGMKYPTETTVNTLPNTTPVVSPNPEIDTLVKNYFNPMPDDSYKITSEQLKPLLDADASKYLVVDVRQAVDYAAGHIPGAINVPFGPEIAKNLINLKSLSQGKTIIVYCYTGQTAGQVDSMMNILGIPTKSLHFGFGTPTFVHGWSSTGYPTEVK